MKKMLALAMILGAAPVLAGTQLTIYNQNFATVKETRALDLAKGESEVRVTDVTAHLEPDSVVLRDLANPDAIRILEQNYESDPLSEGLLLRKSEGKTLDFEITMPQTGERRIVPGKILRSGYVPHTAALQRYGQQYAMSQMIYSQPQGGGQPIVEVDGKIQFGLPGKPIFAALDPKAFRPAGAFEDDVDAVIDVLHATPPLDPARPVLVAGDPERSAREQRLREGIPMPDALLNKIKDICERSQVKFIL